MKVVHKKPVLPCEDIENAPVLGEVCEVVGREGDGYWMGIYDPDTLRSGNGSHVWMARLNNAGKLEMFPYGTKVRTYKGAFVIEAEASTCA